MALPSDPDKYSYMFTDDIKFVQKAVVFHPTDTTKFLIIRRSLQDRSRAGEWDLPGGNVLYGELAEDSIRKEIKEETGLQVDTLQPVHIRTEFKHSIYYFFIRYTCKAISDKVILSNEHIEYTWVTKEEFEKYDTSGFLLEIFGRI